jgi:hypothetical protein
VRETDEADRARFYENIGFPTVGEAEVLGVPSWLRSLSV